jgi:molybdopterin synthase catalytic subunit
VADAIFVEVTEAALDPAALLARVSSPGFGAQTLFLGVVRDHHLGRPVASMTYDGFAPLAEKVLRAVAAEALERFGPALRVAVAHRTGHLRVGEASVAIAVGAAHRAAAYEASRYVIEELKARAPLWKEEHHADGTSEWLDGQPLRGGGDVGRDPRRRPVDEDGP